MAFLKCPETGLDVLAISGNELPPGSMNCPRGDQPWVGALPPTEDNYWGSIPLSAEITVARRIDALVLEVDLSTALENPLAA